MSDFESSDGAASPTSNFLRAVRKKAKDRGGLTHLRNASGTIPGSPASFRGTVGCIRTGLLGLDRLLQGVELGDSIVWETVHLEDLLPMFKPFYLQGIKNKRKVVYVRFAKGSIQLVEEGHGVIVRDLDTTLGFNSMVHSVLELIKEVGRRSLFIFDCLSELAADWYSDRMVGNFFMLICPSIHALQCVAYFPIYSGLHSYHAMHPVHDTTQILIDVVNHENNVYIHPLKVQGREDLYFGYHLLEGQDLKPVTASLFITTVSQNSAYGKMGKTPGHDDLGYWSRVFTKANATLKAYEDEQARSACNPELLADLKQSAEKYRLKITRMILARDDERIESLALRYFTLRDLLNIRNRMIGTGMIGGKSVGFLLARRIIAEREDLKDFIEPHDSFFIGSDAFHTFLVHNNLWAIHERQREEKYFLEGVEEARAMFKDGFFPDYLITSFKQLLDYMGQSPIIVRSSSLQEDGYGNAFAGKYESVFVVNQGNPKQRLKSFLDAVRQVYSSTLSEEALRYRAARGLLTRDEQMAILVMRVCGDQHGERYFPMAAGVGLSYNPFPWSDSVDPRAGVLRLVFGLGTRAVDRADDDYTRVVALSCPSDPPPSADVSFAHVQRKVDHLSLKTNDWTTTSFETLAKENFLSNPDFPLYIFAAKDRELQRLMDEHGMRDGFSYVLSFDHLLARTSFPETMKGMLGELEKQYDYPVELEFALNFVSKDVYMINILQCRPLQVKGGGQIINDPPPNIPLEKTLLVSTGPVIGPSVETALDMIVYVQPTEYAALTHTERPNVARIIGRVLALNEKRKANPSGQMTIDALEKRTTALIGPGRWGTSSIELGIPTSFAEIRTVDCVVEVVEMHKNLVPDVSLGTHFFNEMVEAEMLYVALYPNKDTDVMNREFCDGYENRLLTLLPDLNEKWAKIIKVVENKNFRLNANQLTQRVVMYDSAL